MSPQSRGAPEALAAQTTAVPVDALVPLLVPLQSEARHEALAAQGACVGLAG